MKYSLGLLLLLFCFANFSCSQNVGYNCNPTTIIEFKEYDYNNIEKEWLKKDTVFYTKLRAILKKEPKEIEKLMKIDYENLVSQGSGISIKKGGYGLGYTRYYFMFIYKNDNLISYKLNLSKEDVLLLEKYGFKLSEFFKETKGAYNIEDYVFYYNYKQTVIPNKLEEKKSISDKMQFYMTPYSGITYGCRGGYGNGILENRCAFKQLTYEQDLTFGNLIYIMHSINLASRLTAIEYYTRNRNRFNAKEQTKIEKKISQIFAEFGDTKIEFPEYDIGFSMTIEEAVNKQLKSDCW